MVVPRLLTVIHLRLGVASYTDEVEFHGHPMVRSLHRTTIEVTKDPHLTIRGDCIIGVSADKGLSELSSGVRDSIKSEGSRVVITIAVPPDRFVVRATGGAALTLESPSEMVIRKSTWVSPRTLALNADAAAKDLPRRMVESLRNPECRALLKIEVQC
jgi:uncharacterized protein